MDQIAKLLLLVFKKKVNHIREGGEGNICLQLVLLEKKMDNI